MFSPLSLRVDDDFVFLRNDYSKHCSEKDMDRIHFFFCEVKLISSDELQEERGKKIGARRVRAWSL